MLSEKLNDIRTLMHTDAIDLVVIGPTANFKWLIGTPIHGDERPCMILISKTKACILIPAVNIGDPNIFDGFEAFKWTDEDKPKVALNNALDYMSMDIVAHVSIDEAMRADFAFMILDAYPNAKKSLSSNNIAKLRMKKSHAEYLELKHNANIADRALLEIRAKLKSGMSETEVAAIVESSFANDQASVYFAIVAAGKNGASPHHMTGDSIIQDGDTIVVDLGSKHGSFSSDITRMFAIGEASEKYLIVHNVVEMAVQAALKASRIGAKASDVDKAARQVIENAGFGEFFIHRTGHGMGMEGHELPYISAASDVTLEANMVYTIEPGIYLPGEFGIRLEESIILREDGPEILSQIPRDLLIC